jgi:hypothetical protein
VDSRKLLYDSRVIHLLLLCAFASIIALTFSPIAERLPGRDSGVFLYTGWRILEGEVPYRDVWDHKGPVIYFINSLGLMIDSSSAWGVWIIQLVALLVTVAIGYIALNRLFGGLPALFGMAVLVSVVAHTEPGNHTEYYNILFQIIIIYLFINAKVRDNFDWRWLAIGFVLALSFLTRANLIGIGIAIVVYRLISSVRDNSIRQLIVQIGLVSIGSLIVIGVFLIYILQQNAFDQFIEAVFTYNFAHTSSRGTLIAQVVSALNGIQLISSVGVSGIAFVAWFVIAILLLRWPQHIDQKTSAVLSVVVIGLPIEVILSGLTGRAYPHYYLTWHVHIAILCTYFFAVIIMNTNLQNVVRVLWGVSLLMVVLFSTALWLRASLVRAVYRETPSIINYINNSSEEHDYVLIWGEESTYNFVTKRAAPTRFVYQYPLLLSGYDNSLHIQEFINDIIEKQPVLIIDTSQVHLAIPPIAADLREGWADNTGVREVVPELDDFFTFVEENYEPIDIIGGNIIYRLSSF